MVQIYASNAGLPPLDFPYSRAYVALKYDVVAVSYHLPRADRLIGGMSPDQGPIRKALPGTRQA
jgi:hypothetical protein